MVAHAKLKSTSNQSDWSMPIQILDRVAGTLVDLTGSSVQIALAATNPPADVNYRGFYGYGTGAVFVGRMPVLTGSTDTGEITIAGPGMLMVYFPVNRMQTLPAGMYRVGMTLANAGRTVQLIIGYLPIRDGVVMPAMAVTS